MSKRPTRLNALKLDELSLVGRPANKQARVTVVKRAETLAERLTKYCIDDDGKAKTFAEIFEHAETQRQQWKANEALYPLFDALTSSIRSISADKALETKAKMARISESVDAFLAAVKDKFPDVEEQIEKLLDPAGSVAGEQTANKGDTDMADEKKVTELEDKLEESKKANKALADKLEKAEAATAEAVAIAKMSDAERAHITTLSKDDKAEFVAMTAPQRKKALKAADADDEVAKIGGQEIRKSVVGESAFAVMKAQQVQIDKQADDIKKANEARQMSDLRKRADDDFPHVPGSTDERAAMLKAMADMDEPVRKSFEAVFTQSEKLAVAAFQKAGAGGGKPVEGSAGDQLDKLAKAYAETNKVTFAKAYDEVLKTDDGKRLYSESLTTKAA